MVKTVSKKETTTSPDGTKKQRKKQARQEAKTMLKLERAQKNEQKAEKKITKMQEELETYRMQVHKFEAKLSEIRSPQQGPAAEVAEAQPDADENESGSAENLSSTAGEENARSENHADISISHDGHKAALSEQEVTSSADDYTYIPVGSEATFVEEGE
jgi:uncharacterized membrane protein